MAKTTDSISYLIDKNLHLVKQTISKEAPKKLAESPTNHLVMIDCSGSMSGDLPQIREQLKKKLPKLLKDEDTLSIVWFSGKAQYGVLLEGEAVSSLADLAEVNKAIDRWLRPVGLTGFKEPLLEVEKLILRLGKKNKNTFSLFFMSDGCDNQWDRTDILKAVDKAAAGLASTTFVEYGYYADRPMLAAMAARAGGTLIFAESFDKYVPQFEAAMQKRPMGGKRIEVNIAGDAIGGFVYALADGDITTYEITKAVVMVPESTTEVFYLSPTSIGFASEPLSKLAEPAVRSMVVAPPATQLSGAYAAMSLFAVRMKPDVVYPILKAIGDVAFIESFSTCFGKQKYSEFMDAAKAAAFTPALRFTKGWDPNKVPADDAFTVLDLLKLLASDDRTRLLLDRPEFNYNRISRGRLSGDENLSSAESEQLESLRAQMAGEKNAKKLKDIQGEIDKLLASKQEALKFTANPVFDGYPIANLTYNESRPNVSVLVKKEGTVDLTSRPEHQKYKIPTVFNTFTFRNYSIIVDGLVNVKSLPVTVSKALHKELLAQNVSMRAIHDHGDKVSTELMHVVLDLQPLPIINRKMVKAVSARELVELEYELTQRQATAKVFKHYQNERFPDAKLKGWTETFGADAATWLKEQGLTEYSGFGPKMVVAPVRDFYMGKELNVKLKGMSKMPSLKEVAEKVAAKKKLNACDTMIHTAVQQIEADLTKRVPVEQHKEWLVEQAASAVKETRKLLYKSAQIKMSILVGQVWFTEFKSLDENELTINVDGQDILGTLVLEEVKIEI